MATEIRPPHAFRIGRRHLQPVGYIDAPPYLGPPPEWNPANPLNLPPPTRVDRAIDRAVNAERHAEHAEARAVGMYARGQDREANVWRHWAWICGAASCKHRKPVLYGEW